MPNTEIPKLEFRDNTTRYVGPFTSLQLGANKGADARYQPFEIEIFSSGFHASRTLSVEELFATKKWIDARVAEVLAAERKQEAA